MQNQFISVLSEANPWLLEILHTPGPALAQTAVYFVLAGLLCGGLVSWSFAHYYPAHFALNKLEKPGFSYYFALIVLMLELTRTLFALWAQLPLMHMELWEMMAQSARPFWPLALLKGSLLFYGMRLSLGAGLLTGMIGRRRWVRTLGLIFLCVTYLQFAWQDWSLCQFLEQYNRAITWNFELMSHVLNAGLLAGLWLLLAPDSFRNYQR